ncbi:outer membrane protein transport protein [Paracrocinitomix mangrovi]|uniref:OmpP1/FadL family transporter n=1 Tax=Paracrocinitomix mangrovi TaxID=2862509 RepID=UPI001C8D5670|nr:outer membrane protein transport protein [Paracrocinitomix mangrovi]UKN02840.1 outer membrane protein transport protein [Paracrocinitomix mangrovi]
MKRYSLILALVFIPAWALFAQNEDDALRYSMTYFGGSARNMSTAGAMSAMGGDFSMVSSNPASLGRFTKSQFSFTPNLEIATATSSFYGSQDYDVRIKGNISNLSYIKAYELDPRKFKNWYSVQIGIGMNRIKSYNQNMTYGGEVDSSILHSFIREANGTSSDFIYDYFPFTAGLAYDVFAIDPGAEPGTYTTQFQNGKADHYRTIQREGGITEFNVLTVSGNYGNKLLLGGSVNVLYTKFYEKFNHRETFDATANWLNWINYTGELDIQGYGLNMRVGAIYMPTEKFRFGLGIETPTAYWMNDYWKNNMSSGTDSGDKFVEGEFIPTGSYEYRIRTPFKANVSGAAVFSKYGSVGVEIEYVDYGDAKLKSRNNSSAPYSFALENSQIDNIYRPAINAKIGLEARITQRVYARGGFAYYSNPYKESSGNNQEPTLLITGGFGYNFGMTYIDIAYVLKGNNEDYYAYDPTMNGSFAQFRTRNSQLALTIGARF